MRFSLVTLKRGLLFFWAAWLTIVLLTNVFDLLKQSGVLGAGWRFASGNYGFMAATTAIYALPPALVTLLFIGVILWEALAAWLMWLAFLRARDGQSALLARVNTAFVVSLALWAAFMLADEILMAYDVEATHMRIFAAQLVTLLVIYLLPDTGSEAISHK